MIGLTPLQRRVFDFTAAQINATGVAPTLPEIGLNCGIPMKSGVHRVLTRLGELGLIERDKFGTRAIRLLKPAPSEALVREVRFLCLDSLEYGQAASREEITARLARVMGGQHG